MSLVGQMPVLLTLIIWDRADGEVSEGADENNDGVLGRFCK
jgi:hypothetical protein